MRLAEADERATRRGLEDGIALSTRGESSLRGEDLASEWRIIVRQWLFPSMIPGPVGDQRQVTILSSCLPVHTEANPPNSLSSSPVPPKFGRCGLVSHFSRRLGRSDDRVAAGHPIPWTWEIGGSLCASLVFRRGTCYRTLFFLPFPRSRFYMSEPSWNRSHGMMTFDVDVWQPHR